MSENWREAGFGIYLHWPFCAAKCPYCDFNSHVSASIDEDRWQRAYLAEIDRFADTVPGREVETIFFGGGTPSLMRPSLVGALVDRIASRWSIRPDAEITLEANPTSVEAGRFLAFRTAGINRVSMGIQALNDTDLKRLGRLHSTEEALKAFDVARENFHRVSFDLIYARQDQTLAEWRRELEQALSLAGDHLSLYQLTIEDGTAFGERHRRGGLKGLPDEDLSADMFELTQELTLEAGYPAYEISNHASPGSEARHNLIYWRSGDYIGIGPGAHGRLTISDRRVATETPLLPQSWLERVEQGIGGCLEVVELTDEEQLEECLMMGLRLKVGVPVRRLEGFPPYRKLSSKINSLVGEGHLLSSDGNLRLTAGAVPLLNAVLRRILA